MPERAFQTKLFAQLSRVGKAVSAPARLELLQVLAQGERTVESLADEAALSIANTSRHLRTLREAGLVESRREGVCVYYRMADADVGRLCDDMMRVAEARLAEFDRIVRTYLHGKDAFEAVKREDLLDRVRAGQVIVLDVRPEEEYRAGHIPTAVNVPLKDLEKKLSGLPRDREVVAYCRGPYCILSYDAVEMLRRHGLPAQRLDGGFPQWVRSGFPVAKEA